MIYVALILAVIIRPSVAAFVFVFVAIVHIAIADTFNDPSYYLSAALFDLFVVSFLASMDKVTLKIIQLQILSGVSLLTNFIGWGMWFAYLNPTVYNAIFTALYLIALIVITQKENRFDNTRHNSVRFSVYSVNNTCRVVNHKHGETI